MTIQFLLKFLLIFSCNQKKVGKIIHWNAQKFPYKNENFHVEILPRQNVVTIFGVSYDDFLWVFFFLKKMWWFKKNYTHLKSV